MAARLTARIFSPATVPIAAARPEVVGHPRGGFTHAVPAGGTTQRIYSGWFPTRSAARRALRSQFS